MAVLTSPPRTRLRFGPQAGLMLAGFGLLIVIAGAVLLVALATAVLIMGNGHPRDGHVPLALAGLGAGLALVRFAVPAALLGIRALAGLTRQLAAAPAVIITTGLIAFIGPELTREIPPPAFPGNTAGTLIVLGLAIASTGVLAAPLLLRGYGLLARSILAPDGEAELAQRVRQLTQTRTEALDTGASEIRRIERDLR